MSLKYYILFLLVLLTTKVSGLVTQNSNAQVDQDSTQLKVFYNYIKWTYNYGTQKEFDSTKKYSIRALNLAKELKDDNILAYAKISAANSLYWQLKTNEARLLLNENLKSQKLKDSIKIQSYLLLGEIDVFEKKFKEGANHLILGKQILEKNGIHTKIDSVDFVTVNLGLGNLYRGLKDFTKAHKYYDKAFEFYKDKSESSYVLYFKSGLFLEDNDIIKAIFTLKNALKLVENNPQGKLFLPTYYLELSTLYHNLKKPDSAIFFGKKGLFKNEDCKLDLLNMAVGDGYLLGQNYVKASNYYNNAIKVSGSKNFEMTINKKLSDVYEKLEDYKKAVAHKNVFLRLKDSITNFRVKQEVTEITEKYESNKKQLEIDKLKIEDLKNQALINKQQGRLRFISIGLLSIILVLGLIFYGYTEQKRQQYLLFTKNFQLAKKLETNDKRKESNKINIIEIEDSKKSKILLSIENNVASEFYLDQNISLAKMSKLVETNTSYLSKIINSSYNKTFSDFVNELRISYTLKNLEMDPEFRKLTIEHISEKSGFSSSPTFYKAFKKYTGLTPSYYIKKLKNH